MTLRLLAVLAAAAFVALAWGESARAVEWCGTPSAEDRPSTVGGHAIRVAYAIGSDGADASAEMAPRIWADVEAIDAWWRGQDPTRTLRFDLARFACGDEIDLTFVRLPFSSAELMSTDDRFGLLIDGVFGAPGFDPNLTKVLVYYDGPVEDDRICGQGGGRPAGFGIAIVFTAACEGVPTAPTAAHELLHAMGAVSSSAPNVCDDSAHVCDAPEDLMYPFASELGLDSQVLDVNRDDYYGHGGPWVDVRTSPWLRQLDVQVRLRVSVSGRGTVTSDALGLRCNASCETEWDRGTSLTLRAVPDEGRRFVRWEGACEGAGPCVVNLEDESEVTAVFAIASFPLTVIVKGSGVVRSSPRGIACRTRCRVTFPSFRPVVLRPTPLSGWRFSRWVGACTVKRLACVVAMDRASGARAVFVRQPVKSAAAKTKKR